MVWQRGFEVNNTERKYALKSIGAEFAGGLHARRFPKDCARNRHRFGLAREYEVAKTYVRGRKLTIGAQQAALLLR